MVEAMKNAMPTSQLAKEGETNKEEKKKSKKTFAPWPSGVTEPLHLNNVVGRGDSVIFPTSGPDFKPGHDA